MTLHLARQTMQKSHLLFARFRIVAWRSRAIGGMGDVVCVGIQSGNQVKKIKVISTVLLLGLPRIIK